MSKILFNLNGEQHLVEVGQGGGVTSDAEVLWDDRQHGELVLPGEVGELEAFQEEVAVLDEDGKPEVLPVLDESGNETFVPVTKTVHKLRVSAVRRDALAVKKTEKLAKDAAGSTKKNEFDALKVKIKAETATAAEVRRALKHLLEKLGD